MTYWMITLSALNTFCFFVALGSFILSIFLGFQYLIEGVKRAKPFFIFFTSVSSILFLSTVFLPTERDFEKMGMVKNYEYVEPVEQKTAE